MTYPLVDLSVAESMHRGNRPFRLRLVFTGNENKHTWVERWWLMLYDGTPDGNIEVRTGQPGVRGYNTELRDNIKVGLQVAAQKMKNGYTYEPGTSHFVPPDKPADPLVGPFAEIRELVRAGPDEVEARDENGEYLMTLSASGAEAVLERDPFRVSMRDG